MFDKNGKFDIDAAVADLKEKGLWTECHEKGHDLESQDNQVCKRCGLDFEPIVKELCGE